MEVNYFPLVTISLTEDAIGQGVWHLLTHRPDKIIGAAAVSAYSSIQGAVPVLDYIQGSPVRSSIRPLSDVDRDRASSSTVSQQCLD